MGTAYLSFAQVKSTLTLDQRILLVIDVLNDMDKDGLVNAKHKITDKGMALLNDLRNRRRDITSDDILGYLASQDVGEEVANQIAGLAVLHGYI